MLLDEIEFLVPAAMPVIGAEQVRRRVVHARVIEAVVNHHEVEALPGESAVIDDAVARIETGGSEIENADRPFEPSLQAVTQLLADRAKILADRRAAQDEN